MTKQTHETKKIMLAGLANSGKTQIFNNLTGSYGVVANYPMTTLKEEAATFSFRNTTWELIDTPGINTLHADSSEALIFRRAMVDEQPDLILQCIDANRLRQSLKLTAELLGYGLPMVLSLNVIDETAKRGVRIDTNRLSNLLGIPVIETAAHVGSGMYDLREAVTLARVSRSGSPFTDEITRLSKRLSAVLPETMPYKEHVVSMALSGDVELERIEFGEKDGLAVPEGTAKEVSSSVSAMLATFKGDVNTIMNRQLGKWTDDLYDKVVTSRSAQKDTGLASRLGYYSRHPVIGFGFLLVFIALSYLGVVVFAGWLAGLMETYITEPIVHALDSVITIPILHDFLIGDFGILTLGLFNAICTILPILSVFFFLFGFLEDIGYLPNLSVLLRRSFTKVGLSGRAVMPIILGFGCKTMATLTTRSLKSRKERLIAIYLIAFAIPCSAQLALNIAILGRAGVLPFIIALVFLVLVEVLAGKILNRVITSDGNQFFIQELPPFRIPMVDAVLKKTGYRLLWFLKEAIPVFILASAIIFFIDLIGLLDILKTFLEPLVVGWLGLPIQMVEALILLIAREEAAAGLILRLSDSGMLSPVQSIIAVVVTTMFVPCFANIVAMFKEAGAKAGILMLIGINISTIALAGVLNLLLTQIEGIF